MPTQSQVAIVDLLLVPFVYTFYVVILIIAILPYQFVPPSGVKKTQISTPPPLVVLFKEADPPGNLIVPPDQATVRLDEPSLVKIKVNEVARLLVKEAAAKVNVQLPVSVAVKTCPAVQVIVLDVPVFPNALTVSEKIPLKYLFASKFITALALESCNPVVIFGVVKAGLVAKTNAPVPVSSVTAVARFALEGVPNQSATPAPKEVMPVPPLPTGESQLLR
jgi:hypothetical protein